MKIASLRGAGAYGLCVAAAAAAVYTLAGRPDSAPDERLVAGWLWSMPAIAAGAMLVPRAREGVRACLALGSSTLAVFAVACHLLRSTAFGLGGDSQDSGFVIEQITKAKHYALPVDGTYAGLFAFYPPAYFQLLGKTAWLLDAEAAWTMKPASLLAVLVVPALAYLAWSRLTGARIAVVIAVFAALATPTLHLHKTHEWISLVLFVPWWLRYVGRAGAGGAALGARGLLAGSALGALLFMTFYYWFFVGALALLAGAIVRRARREPPLDRGALSVLGGSALLASPYWLPLGLEFVTIDFVPLQQRWFNAGHNRFPLPLAFELGALLLLGGLAALIPLPRRYAAAKGVPAELRTVLSELRLLFVACVAWLLIGRLAVELSRPILHAKSVPLMHGVLRAALAVGVVGIAGARLSPGRRDLLAAALVALALGLNLRAYAALAGRSLHEKALACGERRPEEQLARRTASLDLRGKTVLAADPHALQYSPAFSFLGVSAHYAHPAARFAQRYAFLQSLVRLEQPTSVCLLLRHNRFVPVDYVFWPAGKQLLVYLDDFPDGVRAGHLAWPGAGKRGKCLPRATRGGASKRWQRVLDPGLHAAADMDAAARAAAMRFGDERLRAAFRTR